MPRVSAAIAEAEGYLSIELEAKLTELSESIFNTLNSDKAIEGVVVRYCRRRIDRMLKKVDLSESVTITELQEKYLEETGALNIGYKFADLLVFWC